MTTEERDHAHIRRVAEDLLVEEKAERLEGLSEKQVLAELRHLERQGPRRPLSAARAAPFPRRAPRWLWLVAAALAVGALFFVVARRQEIIAWQHQHDEISPDLATMPLPAPAGSPSPVERATAMQREAAADYARGDFAGCLDALDAAERLDPESRDTPNVTQLATQCWKARVRQSTAKEPSELPKKP